MADLFIKCPCCRAATLEAADWVCELFDDGFSLHCEACGFEIAGKDEDWVRAAAVAMKQGNIDA